MKRTPFRKTCERTLFNQTIRSHSLADSTFQRYTRNGLQFLPLNSPSLATQDVCEERSNRLYRRRYMMIA
ncbi:MAG: hypothetical protein ACRC10_06275 [Thermoguttaceae bacterium]